MSLNATRVIPSRALRVLTGVLALAVSNACTRSSPSAYWPAQPVSPGVQISQTKTGGVSVRVLSGMVAHGPPLYVVDGKRMMVDPVRGIDWLQPADILQIRLLKDPSEIAVYVQEGMNGVVVVTTKQSLKRLK